MCSSDLPRRVDHGAFLSADGGSGRQRAAQTDSTGSTASFEERCETAGCVRLVLVGVGVGFLSGFFGVGGGFLIVPALVVLLGLPMHLAVGTSLVAISMNALWGFIGNLQLGTLDWTLTVLFAAGGLVGVLTGGKLAGRLPERSLRAGFAVVVVGLAMYTLGRSVTTLLAAEN